MIVTASYNNKQWYEWQLGSVFAQKYDNFRLIYIDDCSQDGTGDLVEQWIKDNRVEDRVTLIRNKTRREHLANQYDAIHNYTDSDDIIVICDGDDWFYFDGVLQRVNEAYQNGAWITYGQFWYWKKDRKGFCREVPKDVLMDGTIRQFRPWRTSHLRTFYSGLFKKIKVDDLLYENKFFPMSADVAAMLPMLEMAAERAVFIPDVLYIYNDGNSLNFYHDHRLEQLKLENEIRSRMPYKRVDADKPYHCLS